MKREITFLLVFILTWAKLFATVEFWQKKESYTHLVEINSQWQYHKNDAPKNQIVFSSDKDRIAYHLDLVIAFLSKNEPTDFSDKQLQLRRNLLKELADYSVKRNFPINTFHKIRTPYFIDEFDNYCAVGFLIKVSGNADLAKNINAQYNYNYVEDIKTEGVAEWAFEHGFTVDELKWIQPGYNPITFTIPIGERINGPIRAMYNDGENIYFAGEYDSIGARAFDGVLTYDGTNLQPSDIQLKGDIKVIGKGFNDAIAFGGKVNFRGKNYPLVSYLNGNYSLFQFDNADLEVYELALNEEGNEMLVATRLPSDSFKTIVYLVTEKTKKPGLEVYGRVEDLLFEAMVGFLDSVLVIENGIKRHIGKGGFLSFKNGEWTFPELVYNKSVLPYFTTVTKIKDSLVAFNFDDVHAWTLRGSKLVIHPNSLEIKGRVSYVFVDGEARHLSGSFSTFSMNKVANFVTVNSSWRWPYFSESNYSQGSVDFVTKIDSQIILAGDFYTGNYVGYQGKGMQFNVEYLGAYSRLPSSLNQKVTNGILVYPNPANSTLILNAIELDNIKISSINGQQFQVPFRKEGNKTTVDVSSLPSGNYLIQLIKIDGDVVNSYFVKQ